MAAAEGASIIDAANNPALGAFASDGLESVIGLFSPRRSFHPGPSAMNGQLGVFSLASRNRDSERNYFPVPWLAKAWKLRERDGVVGFSFYGRGGMHTDWRAADSSARFNASGGTQSYPGVYGAGDAGVDLLQAIARVTYASRIGDRIAWGVTPQIALQTFEARGLTGCFFSSLLGGVSNPARNLLNCPSAGGSNAEACLGGDRGAGSSWKNMTVYKAGLQWRSGSSGTWRGGYSYAKQPVDEGDALFDILAPGVDALQRTEVCCAFLSRSQGKEPA